MSKKRSVTMDDALAAGDSVILNVQAARIKELQEQRDELLELLELALAAYNRLLASDSLKAAWTFGGFEAKARAAIAKAKGEE